MKGTLEKLRQKYKNFSEIQTRAARRAEAWYQETHGRAREEDRGQDGPDLERYRRDHEDAQEESMIPSGFN